MSKKKPVPTENDPKKPVPAHVADLKKAANVLRAINHKLREGMVNYIQDQNEGRATVSEVQAAFGLQQSETSQHLAVLRGAGIVTGTRDGKSVIYEVNHDRLALILRAAHELAA